MPVEPILLAGLILEFDRIVVPDIPLGIGDPPRAAVIEPDDHERSARTGKPGNIIRRRVDRHLVPDGWHIRAEMRIIGEDGPATQRFFATGRPVIAPVTLLRPQLLIRNRSSIVKI